MDEMDIEQTVEPGIDEMDDETMDDDAEGNDSADETHGEDA
jgi:hypothetical protein